MMVEGIAAASLVDDNDDIRQQGTNALGDTEVMCQECVAFFLLPAAHDMEQNLQHM